MSHKPRNKRAPGPNDYLSLQPDLEPITPNQHKAHSSWNNGQHLVLHGSAGTGKTMLGLWFAMQQVFDRSTPYSRIVIIRSAVPTREMGFLPGTQAEKMRAFEDPYSGICTTLCGRGDAYQALKTKRLIEFLTTSYIRGITLDECIIIVDEPQNCSFGELDSVLTRVGVNSRIIFCGDTKQDDLTSERFREKSGFAEFIAVLDTMSEFDIIKFTTDDIVRSDLVKSYIIAKERMGL